MARLGAVGPFLMVTLPTLLMVGGPTGADEPGQEEWFFGTKSEFEKTAATLRIMANQETTCTFQTDLSGVANLANTDMIIIEDADGIRGFSLGFGSNSPVHAHAADVVSTHNLLEGGFWATRYTHTISFTSWISVTAVGHDLAPRETTEGVNDVQQTSDGNGHEMGDYSIAFSVDCDRPAMAALSGDRFPFLIAPLQDDSGVGAWAHFTAALIAARAEPDYTVSDVRFRTFLIHGQITSVHLDHPEGESDWFAGPDTAYDEFRYDGGPGQYSLLINHLSHHDRGRFYSFLAGFHEIDHLDEIAGLPSPE